MNRPRHTRLVELFAAAVELPRGERRRFLDEHVRDPDERAELERLLSNDEAAGGFLDAPSPELAAALDEALDARDRLAPSGPSEPLEGRDRIERPERPERPERIGRYRIERVLGSGAMGLVYLARQDGTGQPVALKLLRPAWTDPQAIRRFEQEVKVLGRLQHPGIARILDAGRADLGHGEQAFFAMEWVQGSDLYRYGRASGRGLEERVRLLVDLCAALHHAHRQGVIHRDLKPDNVLVTADGAVKILDFGVARVTDPDLRLTTLRTNEAQIVGTLAYMSPEQAAGDLHRIDRRSDVYALGVVAYELLSGRLPVDLDGDTFLRALRRVQDEDPPPLRLVDADLPRDLEIVVGKALEKEPERRYADAAALGDDLSRWLRHEPITARPHSATYTLRRMVRRHRGLAAGLAVAFAVLIVGVVVSGVLAVRAMRAATEARWRGYQASLAAASSEIQAGSAERAVGRLALAPAELRGLEYRVLRRLADPSAITCRGHAYNVWNVAVAPDGRRAYSCAGDATVRVWDLASGEELRVLRDHDGRAFSVAAGPDGARMASGSADRTVRLRDAASLATVAVLTGHDDGVFGLAFSNDARWLASGANNGTLRLWDGRDGSLIRELAGHARHVWSIAFAPDDRSFATASDDGTVKLWDPRTGAELATLHSNGERVVDVTYAPDGERLALATTGGELELWDVAARTRVAAVVAHAGELGCVDFAPNGSYLAAGARDGTLSTWSATGLERLATRRGHHDWVQSLAFTRDGARLVSGSWDDEVRVWEAGRLGARCGFDPWSGVAGFALGARPGTVLTLRDDGAFEVREIASGRLVGGSAWPSLAQTDLPGRSVRLARDRAGTRVGLPVTGSPARVRVLDLETGRVLLDAPGLDVAVHPDGRRAAIVRGGRDAFEVFDLAGGESLGVHSVGESASFSQLAFHPRRPLLFAPSKPDCSVSVRELESGREIASLVGHGDAVTSLDLDPTGELLATSGADRVTRLWSTRTFELVTALAGHGDAVESCAFSPDGRRIVTGCRDGTLRIWSAATFEELVVIAVGGAPLHELVFTPEGAALLVGCADGRLFVFDAR